MPAVQTNAPISQKRLWQSVLWIARITGIAVLVPVLMIFFGEPGSGPANVREWIYLALFPCTFAIGYLLAWRWPVTGGILSLASMAASLFVTGRVYGPSVYLIWAAVSLPGVLCVLAGLMLRRPSQTPAAA